MVKLPKVAEELDGGGDGPAHNNRIKFLQSRRYAFTELKKTPFAVSI